MSISVRIKVILPSKLFGLNFIKEEIRQAQKNVTAPKLKAMFRQTVQGWDNPPYFDVEQTENFNMIAIKVFASGRNEEQYRMVNNGAKEHIIDPNKGIGFLSFQENYIAGTRPGTLRSRRHIRYGNWLFLFSKVYHPGFDGRYFDEQIADLSSEEFVHDMEEAIHIGVGRTESTS